MDEKLTSYLLGGMTEAEQIRLEEEFFADDEKFQQLRAAQDDLLDAYARGSLTPAERELIERHLLSSPWLRERLQVAEAIAEYVGGTAAAASPTVGEPVARRRPWRQALRELLWPSASFWRVAAAGATALLLGAAGLALFEVSRLKAELEKARAERAAGERRGEEQRAQISEQQARLSEQERQLAGESARSEQLARELEQERQERAGTARESRASRRVTSGAGPPAVLSLLLTPQALRGGGGLPQVTLRPGTTSVNLRLSLGGRGEYKAFRAELQTADGEIVKNWGLPRHAARGGELRVRVPAALLKSDDYTLALKGQSERGEFQLLGNYTFRVSRERDGAPSRGQAVADP